MKKAVLAAAVVLAAACGFAQEHRRDEPRADADLAAAKSLEHSLLSLSLQPGSVRGGAARLLALARLASTLAPGDVEIARFLTDLHESAGRYVRAAKAAETCLRANSKDCALGRRWLALRLACLQDADKRIQFLQLVMKRADYPACLRSAAAVACADVLAGQGRWHQAAKLHEMVLREFDPRQPQAVRGLLAIQKDPPAPEFAAALIKLLKANPAAVDVAWDLAVAIDVLGLHAESLEFFEYAWRVARRKQADSRVSHAFVTQYFNAMLNAGLFAEAVKKFKPLTKRFPKSLDLHSLLAEAHQALAQSKKAEAHIDAIAEINKPKAAGATVSPAYARDLATFNLVSRPGPSRALAYARLLGKLRPADAVTQRLLGGAELLSGDPDLVKQGLRRLEPLAAADLYAAAFLAEHYYASDRHGDGQRTILTALAAGGSGPAFRRLRDLARRQRVTVPAPPGRREVRKLINEFDRTYLRLGLYPEKFLSVSLTPPRNQVAPGEPVVVRAKLTNTSKTPIRVGDWGVLNPRMDLIVMVTGPKASQFKPMPLVRWPAPVSIAPGATLSVETRVDAGPLGDYLARRPLDELSLTVAGMLDPVQTGRTFQSWLPTVPVKPVKIVRTGLLGRLDPAGAKEWPAMYQKLLVRLTRDIKRGALRRRMLAARQVGALLGLARDVELGRAELPEGLRGVVTKPMLLSMTRALLADRSAAVRAEMISALGRVRIGKQVLQLLSGALEDNSVLVRVRMIELLGASDTRGRRTILDYFARDEDEIVRLMASAFEPRPPGGAEEKQP